MSTTPSAHDIKSFYDAFSATRLSQYRTGSNLRIERAINFFLAHIEKTDFVLDVGCGIGIASEAMAKKAENVVGVDVSERNIVNATSAVARANLKFYCADVTNDESLSSLLPSAPTIFTLCDVIEHIPEHARIGLFKKLRAIGTDRTKVLITYPTEFYLEYLEREDPDELQIIDSKIPADRLAREAAAAGFSMTYFRVIDVWRHAQYAHCVLETTEALRAKIAQTVRPSTTTLSRIKRIVRQILGPKKV
jgi:cyclopropane fatty-acyl-phospholipid synthase-like methyltransferase